MEGGHKGKTPKMDLICNVGVDLWNSEALKSNYFENGSIYLGSKQALNPNIYEQNIGAVVTVMDKKSYEKQEIRQKIQAFGLKDHHFYVASEDHKQAQLKDYYGAAFDFIEKNLSEGHNILIHCKGGMSRSPAILCSYLMKKFGLTFEKCYQLIRSRRSVVSMNEGFQKQLKRFELSLFPKKK